MEKNNSVKNIVIVSGSTILSRLFGFFRDMTFFAFFGISELGGAFLLAFSLPNLFRKLLGEGALSSAIVPILSAQYTKNGKESMLKLFSHIFFRLLGILLIILMIICILMAAIKGKIENNKWALALSLTIILFPYMVLICLAAVVSAALNILGKFFISSINQVWMNISMILALIIGGLLFRLKGMSLINCLIIGVMVGGCLQLMLPLIELFRCGWRPKLTKKVPNLHENLMDIWKLFLPGVFGAAIEQLNLIISRTIAFGLHPSAVSLLYLASRVVELPVGVFGIAITTVFFPKMAKILSTSSNSGEANKTFMACLVSQMWILIPSSIGMFILSKEILSFLFVRGKFLLDDVYKTIPILSIYCISMIFSGALALFVRTFHAMRDTKIPMIMGFFVLIINVICSLILIKPYGVTGLAIATTVACIMQTTGLGFLLKKKMKGLEFLSEKNRFRIILRGCIYVGFIASLMRFILEKILPSGTQTSNFMIIIIAASLSLLIYLIATKKLIQSVLTSTKSTSGSI